MISEEEKYAFQPIQSSPPKNCMLNEYLKIQDVEFAYLSQHFLFHAYFMIIQIWRIALTFILLHSIIYKNRNTFLSEIFEKYSK